MPSTGISNILSFIKRYDYRLWVLTFGWFISAMGFAMVIPFISILFHMEMGISMVAVGTVFSISSMSRALFGLLGGEASDRWGRVKIMGFSMLGRAGSFLLIALLLSQKAGFIPIAGLVILSSVLGAFYQPVAHAMVADVVGKEKRVEAFSIIRIGGNLGWAVGPAIGGFVSVISYSFLFLIGSLTAIIAGGLILLFIKETVPELENKSKFSFKDLIEIRKDRLFFIYCVISLFLFTVIGQLIATFSVFSVNSVGISKTQLGYLYTLNGGIVVLFQFPMSKFVERYRLTRVLLYGSLLYFIGYALVGIAGSFAWLFACMTMVSVAEIAVMPASMTMVANMASEKHRGRYMGTFSLAHSLGWSIGPLLGGILLDLFVNQPIIVWSGISSLALISALGYQWLGNKLPVSVDFSGK
jgi:MFS family permease